MNWVPLMVRYRVTCIYFISFGQKLPWAKKRLKEKTTEAGKMLFKSTFCFSLINCLKSALDLHLVIWWDQRVHCSSLLDLIYSEISDAPLKLAESLMDKCVTVRYAHLLILLSQKYCCMCKGSAYVTIVVETTAAVYIIRFIIYWVYNFHRD